jgi:type IV pilus assembly protein PilW
MHGLSLVELMVALTIGLIILAAVSSLFVSSKQTYNIQDSLSRLQENGRFAMQFLIKDIRLAGFVGCLDDVDASTMGTTLSGGVSFNNNALVPFEGVENATGTWFPSGTALPVGLRAGTDAIAIRTADISNMANIAPGMLNGASDVVVDNATPFATGDVVVISDCAGADIMAITGKTGNTLSHASGSLGKAYEPPAQVIKLVTRQYFIKLNGQNVPTLYRQENATVQELVEGIESLQILYGEDTDGPPDGVPNVYRKASAVTDWSKVVSVRVGILVRTVDDKNTDLDNGNYDVDGDGTNELTAPGDRYRRRIFQAVVQLRNML